MHLETTAAMLPLAKAIQETGVLQPPSKSQGSEKHNSPVARHTPLPSHCQRTVGRHTGVLGGSELTDLVSRENPKQMNLGFSHVVLSNPKQGQLSK